MPPQSSFNAPQGMENIPLAPITVRRHHWWQAMAQPSYYFRPSEVENHRKTTITPNDPGDTVWGPKPGPALRGQATSPWAGHKPSCACKSGNALLGTRRRLKWLPSDGEVPAWHSHESSVPRSNTSNMGLSSRSTKSPETTGC